MTFIVTGASRGLGLEIARRLLEQGSRVVAVQRTVSERLRELCQQSSGELVVVECDLEEPQKIKQSLQQAVDPQWKIEGLVNNAAVAYDDLATNLNLERLEAMFRTNVFAAMELSKWAIRRMLLLKNGGSLVHISSISVHTGYKGLAMYAATKGALEAYSKNLAREWGPKGIRSNCVVAGFMETDMSSSLSDQQREKIYRRTALQQSTSIKSVAATTAFLLGADSASITGQSIFVDAGSI